MVNEKNQLLRQEADLVYELRDLELIEQHDELEKEIRQRLLKDGEPGVCYQCVTISGISMTDCFKGNKHHT